MNNFDTIIDTICKVACIKITYLSDNWIKVLEKDGQVRYIEGYKFDLNNHGVGNIIDDKGLFYDICKLKNLPIIEHYVIFKDYDKDSVIKYFHKNHNEIVIKGNIGTCGKEVYKVNNEKDLFNIINELFKSQYSISLCPYYQIKNEYRTIYLNKELRIIYGKERPLIIGDGIHTIGELAIKYNAYFKDNKPENNDLIPKKGEKILLNFQFNLSKGARMFFDIDNNLEERIKSLSKEVINKLDLKFVSIDIIHTIDDKLLIMEANSGIMMDNYIRFNPDKIDEVINLYTDAILLMFNKR